ncbi:MAG: prepilin-type N-terminal cleavage/methylation domain-containing protein [Bacilli bacterium]|nr:prepilin-type N-terminal cleavage/methylation domain-containing protein [Bacilli bacterium]
MNNKGLTLVEVIATLVVLSIVALIVTPNIAVSIKDYKKRTLESQLSAVEGATKNWVADNIDKVNCTDDDSSALMVDINKLQTDAYLDEKLKNPNGGYLDSTDTFGLVSCKTVVDETNNLETNYKYTYGAFLSINDYLEHMAIEYVKDNNNIDATVTTSTLQNEKYVYRTIKNLDGISVSIPSKTISVKVTTTNDGKYNYETKMN